MLVSASVLTVAASVPVAVPASVLVVAASDEAEEEVQASDAVEAAAS